MKKGILLLMYLLGHFIGHGQGHINYDNQGKLKIVADDIQIRIDKDQSLQIDLSNENPKETEIKLFAVGPILTTLLPLAIDLIKTGISNYNEREKAAYDGSYSVKVAGDQFYNTGYTKANLPKLIIQRNVVTADGERLEAASIELIPKPSADKKAFQYELGRVNYPIFIAKVKNDYDFILPHIELKFTHYYMEEGTVKNIESTVQLKMPPIQIGDNKDFQDQHRCSDWIMLPPKSTDAKKSFTDMSLYEIQATVNEMNLYKSKAIEKDTHFDNNQEATIKLLNEIIKQGLEKKE